MHRFPCNRARVIHQDIDLTIRCDDTGHKGLDGVLTRHVAGDRRTTYRFRYSVDLTFTPCRADNLSALRSIGLGNSLTNASTRSGYDRYFVLQTRSHAAALSD